MLLTSEQVAELEIVAQPLMDWIEVNCHPHITAIVDSHRVELLEGIASVLKSTNAAS